MSSTDASLSEVIELARPIVERVVWCSVATVGPDGAPRTRLMHPVWFWEARQPFAYVTARRTPVKIRHIDAHPVVSCFYWDPHHDTVAIDAEARWLGADELRTAWDAIHATPAPVGFDPAIVWPDGPASPGVAMLCFSARRVIATPAGRTGLRWSAPSRSAGAAPGPLTR